VPHRAVVKPGRDHILASTHAVRARESATFSIHGEELEKQLKHLREAALNDCVDRRLMIQAFKKDYKSLIIGGSRMHGLSEE